MPSDANRVIVINPNSNQAVTNGMASALEPLVRPGGPQVECMTLFEGPFGIESQADNFARAAERIRHVRLHAGSQRMAQKT